MSTSFLVSCPFCIDLNSREFPGKGLSEEEMRGLQGLIPLDGIASLDPREKAALRFVECICSTPLSFTPEVINGMREHFTEHGIVIVASTCAQVNLWARVI